MPVSTVKMNPHNPKEKELVASLNKKYGTGTVDLESGEFVPRS